MSDMIITRSNYFSVRDPDAFRALLADTRTIDGQTPVMLTDRQVNDEFGVIIKYGFQVKGQIAGIVTPPTHNGPSCALTKFLTRIQELVSPTDACCIVSAGYDGAVISWREGWVITRKDVREISMKDTVLLTARQLLNDPNWTTSLDCDVCAYTSVPPRKPDPLTCVTEFHVSLEITEEENELLRAWLGNTKHQPADDIFVRTAVFPDGRQMDIKCCGVQDEEQSSWAEAVLFESNGQEICCAEPTDLYTGAWTLSAHGVTYVTDVAVHKGGLRHD